MRHRKIILLSLVLALSPCADAYIGIDLAGPDDPQYGKIQLGMGVDLINGQAREKAVGGPVERVPFIEEVYSLYLIETREELAKAMGLSVDVSANEVAWSASTKLNWSKNYSRSANSVTLYVSVKVTTAIQRFKGSPDPCDVILGLPLDQFLQRAGTHYISAIREGGELYAILTIDDMSETMREQLSVSLSGRYATYSASADLTTHLERFRQSHKVQLDYRTEGGLLTLGEPNVANLITACDRFAKTVKDNAHPQEAELSGYEGLLVGRTQIENQILLDQMQVQQDQLIQWHKYWLISQRLRNIAEHPDEFTNIDVAKLDAARDAVDGKVDQDGVTLVPGILPQIMTFLKRYPSDPGIPVPRIAFDYSWPAPKDLDFVGQKIARYEVGRLEMAPLPDNLVMSGTSDAELGALADFYELLAKYYERRQFLYARMYVPGSDPSIKSPSEIKSLEDAYKAALYMGISYYIRPADRKQELRAKGYAELRYAKGLEEDPLMMDPKERSPILKNIVGDNNWPRGVDGDLILEEGTGPWTLLAGTIMDFNRIRIAQDTHFSIVGYGDKRRNDFTIQPSRQWERNASWHDEFAHFTADTKSRYNEIARTYEQELGELKGQAGAITLLGCRTDCTIDGMVDYNGLSHDGGTWSVWVPFQGGNQLLSYKIVQATGGFGGSGGLYGGRGGEDVSCGYGSGGGGGGGGRLSLLDMVVLAAVVAGPERPETVVPVITALQTAGERIRMPPTGAVAEVAAGKLTICTLSTRGEAAEETAARRACMVVLSA